jgi:hypothetical protein
MLYYVPKCFDQQPLDGGQLGYSRGRSSAKGDSPGKPPFNPPIGSFGWPAPNSHMFIPPWYQPPIM